MSDEPARDSTEPLDPKAKGRLAEYIAAHTGLAAPDWVLEARLRERVAAAAAGSLRRYADLVTGPAGADELDRLIEALRVGETRLFRHAGHIKALSEVVVPELRERRAGGRIKAWSAGCASGEEAYTLATILTASLPRPTFDVRVTASDLSAHAITTARAGRYPVSALDHVPEVWRERAFVAEPDGAFFRIADEVARCVTFERRNLLDGPHPARFELIWCRNVLIYFTPEARHQAVSNLVASLTERGILFVGYSESLRDVADLEPERIGDAVIYRKARPSRRPLERITDPALATRKPAPESASESVSNSASISAPASESASVSASASESASVSASVSTSASASAPASISDSPSPRPAAEVVIHLDGNYDEPTRLSNQLASALERAGDRVLVDLDGVAFLDERAAAILRRAQRTARADGIAIEFRATRTGAQRWLRRHQLDRDEPGGQR